MMSTKKICGLGMVAIAVLAVANVASAGFIVEPAAAVSNTEYDAAHAAAAAIDPTDLSGSNQHVAEPFSNGGDWVGTDGWGTWENWIYLDLGAAVDLEEIRIWNYHEDAGTYETIGRSVKTSSLWVAGPGATLPPTGTPTGEGAGGFTEAMGWTQLWAGDLNPGPSTVAPVPDIDPTDTFAVANTGVQYVGINIDSRWGGNASYGFDENYPTPFLNYAPGLAHIQVVAVPEPGTFVLLVVGGLMLFALSFRRR